MELFKKFFGALTRFALAGVVGFLVRKGVIDGALGEELLLAAVIGIPTLIWSLWQKYKDRLRFLTALSLPANSRPELVDATLESNSKSSSLLSLILIFAVGLASLTSIACGKEQIENSFAKTVVALRSARKVTTVQHKYGHIDDAAYKSRLLLFDSANDAVNQTGDTIAGFGEITPGNKQQVLDEIKKLADTVDKLVADGDVGVKNPESQNDYRRWLMVAKGVINSAKVAIAAIDKPVAVKDLKIPKANLN